MATSRHMRLLTEARLAAQEVIRRRQDMSIRAGDIFLCQLSAQLLPMVLDILAYDENDEGEPGNQSDLDTETTEGEPQDQPDLISSPTTPEVTITPRVTTTPEVITIPQVAIATPEGTFEQTRQNYTSNYADALDSPVSFLGAVEVEDAVILTPSILSVPPQVSPLARQVSEHAQ